MIIKLGLILLTTVTGLAGSSAAAQQETGWPTYGGDPGGQHYSAAAQITPRNVNQLRSAWTYHTHALDSQRPGTLSAAFESTPVLFENILYLTTPFDHVVALDPATGMERWTFDPKIPNNNIFEGMLVTSRGVATWQALSGSLGSPCRSRVFLGTLNGQLWAIDAATGKPCEDFGSGGVVDLKLGVQYKHGDSFSVTSAPTVVGNVVVVGSSISDNVTVNAEMGIVRGYDVRSGRLLWNWDPIPWAQSQKIRTGAANAWSTISADPALGMVYVPTGSASPDYYGGMRPGDNKDADSVVALDAATGRKVWAFQTVHHNLWDYDVASEPLLFTFHGNIPAVAITTKMGMLFVLDRRDGKPLYPVEERPVPQSDVPGEISSPTQPFSSLPSLSPLTLPTPPTLSADVGWTRSAENQKYCQEQIARLRYDGVYTPPSIHGTMIFPGSIGGVNWGGPALDPSTGVLYANTNRLAYAISFMNHPSTEGDPVYMQRKNWSIFGVLVVLAACIGRRSLNPGWPGGAGIVLTILAVGLLTVRHRHQEARNVEAAFGKGISPQYETPYQLIREPVFDHDRNPCIPPPWGTLTAINLNTGKKLWEQPLGTMYPGAHTGSISLGGPIVTAGDLLFSAGTREPAIYAFDPRTGKELWKAALPVPAQSTPMTYIFHGKQFVVIAAGGHGIFRTPQGDSLIAFALP